MKMMIGKYSAGGKKGGCSAKMTCAKRSFAQQHLITPVILACFAISSSSQSQRRLYAVGSGVCYGFHARSFQTYHYCDTSIGEMFVGGELRWNNSTDELTREAADIFKGRRICSIINIGSGHTGHMSLSKGLADLFTRIALDCERVADDMERRFGNTPEVYWRLTVEQGLQGLTVDLSNLDALVAHTNSYLRVLRRHAASTHSCRTSFEVPSVSLPTEYLE
ncbi:hypothetical protein DL96DRAFT_611120 [Flagelloscypha sp. PMI_526]|nr:hypothetical protein DL96DRAFT_611120 [Flagelloscypha sp. PMI_526]